MSESNVMMAEDYRVVSVEQADPPSGLAGNDWHCYTIGQGSNRIYGYRRGNLASVTQSVEAIVERMNERRFGKRGRVHLDMSSSGRSSRRR